MFEELAEVSPKKGVPPNPTLRTQVRRPSKGAQPSDPSLAIGSSAAPVARGRRPSHPKVPEGAVNSQGWVREPAPMHGAAALAGYADKSTSSGSRVLHRDGPEHTSNMDDAEGVLCVNSLVPTRAPDLPGTAADPSSERQKPSPTRAGENLKGEPSLKSLKDTLCKLEEDKERSLSHAAKCKKTFDRLAMVNAFQTPAMAARIKATASSESNIVPEELAQGEQNAHTGANAIAVRSVSGANAAPSAERIDSIEVAGAATEPQGQFVTEGRTTLSDDGNAHAGADAPAAAASSSTASALVAPFGEGIKSVELAGTTSEGQFITADADGRTSPSSTPQGPPSHGETSLGNSGAASQPAGPSGTQQASSHSGRHRGAAAPPPSGPSTCGSGSGALSKRRNSSPAPRQATDAGGGMGGMGGGLQLSGVKAELSSHQQRPASGKRQQASKSPETVQTHDYLRRGASRIASGASGRPRSRSRGREELRAEGRHVEMSGIDGLPGHYTGNQEYDGSRGLRSMGNKGNQAASGNPNASQAGKHPDQASTSTCGSMAGAPGAGAEASVRSTTNASRGGKDQQSTVSDAPTKEVEELDIEVDEVDVEEHSIKNHMKQLRRLLLVMRLWTGTKGERNGEGDDAADNQADESQDVGDMKATYSSLDEPVKQVFDVVATVKVSGGKLCTQKSFENLMVTLQEMDQEKRKAHRKIPLSAIREAFQEQIALQISLSSRYGLSAAEASKGMVFETFRTCMHRLFYRPLEKEEDVKGMLLRMDR